jgi:hypothetical protein
MAGDWNAVGKDTTRYGLRTTNSAEIGIADWSYGPSTPGLPTASQITTGTGNLDNGTYYYACTFVTADGETAGSTATPTLVTVDGTHKQVALTNIPVSSSSLVTARKIYRTTATPVDAFTGTIEFRWYRYVGTINDNTTTTYTDNIANATVDAAAVIPAISTANPYISQNGSRFGNLFGNSIAWGQGSQATGTGYANIGMGINALNVNTTGLRNVYLGYFALSANTTGNRNTAIGTHALNSNVAATDGTAVGFGAMFSLASTQISPCVAVGSYALYNYNHTSGGHVAVGYRAGYNLTTGVNNTVMGHQPLFTATGAQGNVAIGHSAMYAFNASPLFNTVVGMQALDAVTAGNNNTVVGFQSYHSATGTVSGATALGQYAGKYGVSNEFYVNGGGIDWANTSAEKAGSLLYGVFNATTTSQRLQINAPTAHLGVAVASLPAAAAALKGFRMWVTDSNAASYTAGIGAIVAAGGATIVPVFCDGTNWRIG